ncbi:hypothetical protein ACFL20_02425 [Spirochaetota bacterium]
MKKSPKDSELYDNLQPSKFTGDGFLGTDTRPVAEIIASDKRKLEELGLDNEGLSAKLDDAFIKAQEALGAEVQIKQGVSAVYYESRGRIPSPFKGEGTFEKGEVVITEINTGERIIITRLSIHLIEKHGFFQGAGSRYRLDPGKAVKLLFS